MSAPMRWKDDASPVDTDLRALMKHAAARGPSEAQLAAMAARARAELTPSTEAAATPETPAVSAGRLAGSVKLASWTALSMLAGVGLFSLGVHGVRPNTASTVRVEREALPVEAVDEAIESAPIALEMPLPSPAEHGSDAAALNPVTHPRSRKVIPREPVRDSTRKGTADVGSEQAELQLLHQARSAQRESLMGALSLLRQHEREYPEGTFREEREALIIELLARTGEREQARARSRSFLSRYPASAYRARLAAWLEDVAPSPE